MTLLAGPVVFGAWVRYSDDRRLYLVVGWANNEKTIAALARPNEPERLVHVHWLSVIKSPRRWKSRARG